MPAQREDYISHTRIHRSKGAGSNPLGGDLMRKMIIAAVVAGLLWLCGSPVVSAGDSVPDGNGALPIMMIGGDNVPDGNG